MVDIKFIRENAELVKDAAQKKGIDPKIIDDLLETDKLKRELMSKAETIRAEQKKFDFKPKDHIQLGKDLDIIDFERGAKVAGFRGYYLKNDGVLLAMGVM